MLETQFSHIHTVITIRTQNIVKVYYEFLVIFSALLFGCINLISILHYFELIWFQWLTWTTWVAVKKSGYTACHSSKMSHNIQLAVSANKQYILRD